MSNQIVITSGAKLRDLDDVIIGTDGILSSVAFNVANGVPRLDENGKILVSQLPNSVMEFKGVWNASTNSPTLVNGTGSAGDVWLCNVAGTVNFGAGPIAFAVGDYAVYTGTVWARSSGATGTVTSVGVSRDGNALTITGSPVTTSGTINLGFSGDNTQYINGAGNLTTFPTLITSIGLTMPAAFNVSNSPLTANGTIGVAAAGYASQYIRGDGTLADFPTSGGGGSSVSYYFNGGTSQGTIGGTTYYEMSKTADTGTGVDFNKTGDGFIVAFLTDANDPNLLQIPAGNWDFEIYASMSANGGTPELYAELYKYDGTTFTLIATSSHEILYDGVNLNLYSFATAVPQTSLTVTDRLAIKLYADNSGGKTTTIHTQDSHLCQVITTFSTGLTALNGLTAQVQYFGTGTSGSDFNIVSSVDTHTFNLPTASATKRGALSSADWSTFNDKQDYITAGTTLQYWRGDKTWQTLDTSVVPELTNLYFTNTRSRTAISLTTTGTSGAATYDNTTGVFNIPSYIGGVTSVFGRTGAVVATDGDYTLTLLGDVTITSPSSGQVLKYNGTFWINDTDANTGTVTSVAMTVPTGLSIAGSPITSSGTLAVTFTAGYSIPTNASQTTWDTAYTNRITSLTVTGSSGASTLVSNVLNIPTYTLSGLGGQPLATNLTSLSGLTFASTSFVKMTAAGTFALDTNIYLTTASAASTYLPLIGGTLTGDLTITTSGNTASSVNSTSTANYSYFSNQEAGVLKTYFLYLNSLFVDVDRRKNLEIRNQDGPITIWSNAVKALTISTSQNSTFLGTIAATNLSGTNTGDQTLAGLGGVPTSRTLTINGVGYDLSADRSWTITAGISGSGTANKVAKFTSASAIGDSIITATADAVTITSTLVGPIFVLEQLTAAAYSQMQFKGDTRQAYIFKGNSTYTSYGGTNALNFYTDSGADAGGFAFHPQGTVNAVFIDNVGNLGIGVGNAPTVKLDIAGGNAKLTHSTNGGAVLNTINPSAGSSAYSGLLVGNNVTTAGGGFLMLGGNYPTTGPYTSNGAYAFGNQAGGLTIAAEVGTLKFVTGSTIKGTMLANGNLGLNETNPTNLLHLAGSSATPSLRLASTSTGYYWDIGRENATTGDFIFNYKTPSTTSTEWVRITTLGLFGIGVTPSGTYGRLTVAGGIRTVDDNNSKLELGRYSSANPYAYIKLGTNATSLRISNAADATDLFYFTNTGNLGIGFSPSIVGYSGKILTIGSGTQNENAIEFYSSSTVDGILGDIAWLNASSSDADKRLSIIRTSRFGANNTGSMFFYIKNAGTFINTLILSPTLTTINGELTLTGSSTHMNIVSDTSYAYTRYQGGANDMYLIQNLPTLTNNGVSAGAAYLYMSNSQQFEFNWSGVSKVQITSTGQATFAADVIAFSDISVKENIRPIENVLTRINNSRGVLYDRIDTKTKNNIGFIAQELEKEFPELISTNNDGTKGVKYQNAVAVLFEAIKEQQKQINQLKNIN